MPNVKTLPVIIHLNHQRFTRQVTFNITDLYVNQCNQNVHHVWWKKITCVEHPEYNEDDTNEQFHRYFIHFLTQNHLASSGNHLEFPKAWKCFDELMQECTPFTNRLPRRVPIICSDDGPCYGSSDFYIHWFDLQVGVKFNDNPLMSCEGLYKFHSKNGQSYTTFTIDDSGYQFGYDVDGNIAGDFLDPDEYDDILHDRIEEINYGQCDCVAADAEISLAMINNGNADLTDEPDDDDEDD